MDTHHRRTGGGSDLPPPRHHDPFGVYRGGSPLRLRHRLHVGSGIDPSHVGVAGAFRGFLRRQGRLPHRRRRDCEAADPSRPAHRHAGGDRALPDLLRRVHPGSLGLSRQNGQDRHSPGRHTDPEIRGPFHIAVRVRSARDPLSPAWLGGVQGRRGRVPPRRRGERGAGRGWRSARRIRRSAGRPGHDHSRFVSYAVRLHVHGHAHRRGTRLFQHRDDLPVLR